MKENISCNIIQDLLPNYIEDIVSIETKELINSHLDKCISCKKEWEVMNSTIDVTPIKDKKIDYLKGIHKKFRNILLSCIILSIIAFFISIFYSEANIDEAFFTLALYLMIIIFTFVKLWLPLLGSILFFFLFRKTKKKWLISIGAVCTFFLLYAVISIISNIATYGF